MTEVQLPGARFHLPGLFEFYELYKRFLPLFYEHREYFFEGIGIGSVYGAPADCLWGGGRVGFGEDRARDVAALMRDFGVASRLTFSNSLLRPEHLGDRKCHALCALFEKNGAAENGVIVASELLLSHLRERYPRFCFISSTTKVLTEADALTAELDRDEFAYVVPDFRFNKRLDYWRSRTPAQRAKAELLVNECCFIGCTARKACYEAVSRKALGEDGPEHVCASPDAAEGYVFSKAMENPAFISPRDMQNVYLPLGIRQFKIEGRSLGSALVLEFLLYYLTRPQYRLKVREAIYLDHSLDLF